MSDDSKPKERTFEFPMMPIFGVDLGERLGAQEERQKQMAIDLQRLDARFDKVDEQFEKVDARFEKMEARFEKLDAKIDEVDARLTAKIDAVEEKLTARIDAVEEKLTAKIDAVDAKLSSQINECVVAISRLDERFNAQAEARKSDRALMVGLIVGLWVTVGAGVILQFFLK